MASIAAPLANFGGTKTTETFAPVASMASLTLPKTGTSVPPSKATDWPALRGFTPPTMFVPESSMRWECFMPSEPVMPWTMTLLFSSRKIDMSGAAHFPAAASSATFAAPPSMVWRG